MAFFNEIFAVFPRLLCFAKYNGSCRQINFHSFCFFITYNYRPRIFLYDLFWQLLEIFYFSKKCNDALVFDEWRWALKRVSTDLSLKFYCSCLIYVYLDMDRQQFFHSSISGCKWRWLSIIKKESETSMAEWRFEGSLGYFLNRLRRSLRYNWGRIINIRLYRESKKSSLYTIKIDK